MSCHRHEARTGLNIVADSHACAGLNVLANSRACAGLNDHCRGRLVSPRPRMLVSNTAANSLANGRAHDTTPTVRSTSARRCRTRSHKSPDGYASKSPPPLLGLHQYVANSFVRLRLTHSSAPAYNAVVDTPVIQP